MHWLCWRRQWFQLSFKVAGLIRKFGTQESMVRHENPSSCQAAWSSWETCMLPRKSWTLFHSWIPSRRWPSRFITFETKHRLNGISSARDRFLSCKLKFLSYKYVRANPVVQIVLNGTVKASLLQKMLDCSQWWWGCLGNLAKSCRKRLKFMACTLNQGMIQAVDLWMILELSGCPKEPMKKPWSNFKSLPRLWLFVGWKTNLDWEQKPKTKVKCIVSFIQIGNT